MGTNNNSDDSLTLKIPSEGFKVVQHIPFNQKGRELNTLYQTPRQITQNEFNSPELTIFIDSMYQVMKKYEGVGIAANQIGKRLQIFIIEAKADNPRYKVLGPVEKQIFINPIITKVSGAKKNFWHGCLSASGEKRGNVATYEWIEYRCQNLKGEKVSGRLEGFAAVIFQHEFRHLMNGTYLDFAKQFLSKPELDKKIESGELPFFDIAPDTLPLLIKDFEIGQNIEKFRVR
jgi:peptide deformylase